MGLGPPVCQHCQVIATFTEHLTQYNHHGWYCEYCGNTDCTDNAGICLEQWEKYEKNKKFLDFVHHKKDSKSNT